MADITSFPIPTKVFDPAQFAGADGREVELRTTATHIQWRYVGEATWNDLILLSELQGPAGSDGTDGIQPSGSTLINIRETVQTVTGGYVNADAGAIVDMTLISNSALNLTNLSDGQYIVLHISGGDTYSMDWSTNHTISWHNDVPVLSAQHTVILEKVGTVIYGYDAGEVV